MDCKFYFWNLYIVPRRFEFVLEVRDEKAKETSIFVS